MYRQHAGPPPPDPFEAAEKNARACGHVQLGGVALTALGIALAVPSLGNSFKNLSLTAETKTTALLAAVGYIVFLGAWAGLNAWGLRRRSRIAHYSSCAFAIFQIVSCIGWMYGAGILILLFKKEMKGYYDARIGT